jgi:hypothetical protein
MQLTRIASEPEAAAVHCARLTDLHKLKPNQNFMICDAGGGTVVRALLINYSAHLTHPATAGPCHLQNHWANGQP